MANLSECIKRADWKKEKHVPVIEAPDTVAADEIFDVKLSLGKEIAHPNTTEHHIRWITLYYYPEGGTAPFEVGHFEFNAHGESVDGPNAGPVHCNHAVVASMKITKPGTLQAVSYCNIHGVWESSKEISVT
jgi:superoxide reductase